MQLMYISMYCSVIKSRLTTYVFSKVTFISNTSGLNNIYNYICDSYSLRDGQTWFSSVLFLF